MNAFQRLFKILPLKLASYLRQDDDYILVVWRWDKNSRLQATSPRKTTWKVKVRALIVGLKCVCTEYTVAYTYWDTRIPAYHRKLRSTCSAAHFHPHHVVIPTYASSDRVPGMQRNLRVLTCESERMVCRLLTALSYSMMSGEEKQTSSLSL